MEAILVELGVPVPVRWIRATLADLRDAEKIRKILEQADVDL
jgi:hypothetical protein